MFTLFHPKPLLSYRSPQQLTHLYLLVLFVPPSLARSQRVEHSDFVYLDADVIDAMVTDKLTHVDVTDVMHLDDFIDMVSVLKDKGRGAVQVLGLTPDQTERVERALSAQDSPHLPQPGAIGRRPSRLQGK